MTTSLPFVKFDYDGKLVLSDKFVAEDMKNARVVSILGKARMGKSSFLNSIVSRLVGQNCSPFQTLDSMEHCTKGIDYYYVPSHNLLLLDSQGIGHQDSSHDPALLLFIYLISDVIIFNERMMLQNESLKLLEPICAFMTYVDIDEIKKPKLFFRISDGKLVKDPKQNLEMVFQDYNDQYQSIRDSIRQLFQEDLTLVRTKSLYERAEEFLAANDYLRLMLEGGAGFQEAIDEIMMSLPDCDRGPTDYRTKIPEIIEKINHNEKISIEKLDVVGLLTDKEIREWIEKTVDKGLYGKIEVDGTQMMYDANVEPRKAAKKQILTSFTRRFKAVPESVRKGFYEKLSAELNAPIQQANDECAAKAESILRETVEIAMSDREYSKITTDQLPISMWTSAGFEDYLKPIYTLLKRLEIIVQPVKEKYRAWIDTIFTPFYTVVSEIVEEEEKYKKEIKKYLDGQLEEIPKKILAKMTTLQKITDKSILIQRDDDIIVEMVDEELDCVKGELVKMFDVHVMRARIVGGKIIIAKVKEKNKETPTVVSSYPLCKELYSAFLKKCMEDAEQIDGAISKALVERKKKLLFGKLLVPGTITQQIIMMNPKIIFVRNAIAYDTMINSSNGSIGRIPFTIKETSEKVYLPLVRSASDKLVLKGYLNKNIISTSVNSNVEDITYIDWTKDKYVENCIELMNLVLKKIYCKQIVQGVKFPEEFVFGAEI